MRRFYSLDYVRVIAVFMILLCHFFLFSDLNTGVGRYLGGAGNMIFILVSALLYSSKYDSDTQPGIISSGGQKLDYKRFITGRIVKLGSSVWPFLIILATLYLLFQIHFDWLDLILNFFFLGYLGELPGNEHLWFLTVLMACYAEMILLIKFRPVWKWFPWVFLVIMEVLMIGSEMNGFPGHTFSFLGFYGFVFLFGKEFIRESKKLSIWGAIAIVGINILHIWLCYHGLFEKSRLLTFLLSDVCGLSLLMLMLRYLPDNSNHLIGFISGISFEIYIVHHTLCAGPFLRITHWPYGYVLDFLIMAGIAVVLAIGLNMISKRLSVTLQSLISLAN